MAHPVSVYIGHDPRETIGTHVFIESLLRTCKIPVTICFLHKPMLAQAFNFEVAEGTNAFTVSRFLIPFLQGWRGDAIFLDGADMLLRADLGEFMALKDPWKAVQVVKHDYTSRHERKYVGTPMEALNEHYKRKNWASVMMLNCAHFAWRRLTPQYVRSSSKLELLNFTWCPDEYIGDLPAEWNWLADEHGENRDAKLLHWTAGVPGFEHYADSPHADEWLEMRKNVNND